MKMYPKNIKTEKPRPGMPAGSVRLQYTPGGKQRVLDTLLEHLKFYLKYPNLFYQFNPEPIGKDKRTKDTASIFLEIQQKLDVWRETRNDIQESYILRNNYVVEQTAEKMHKVFDLDTKIIDEYINAYFVQYNDVEPKLYSKQVEIDLFY